MTNEEESQTHYGAELKGPLKGGVRTLEALVRVAGLVNMSSPLCLVPDSSAHEDLASLLLISQGCFPCSDRKATPGLETEMPEQIKRDSNWPRRYYLGIEPSYHSSQKEKP